MSQPVPDAAKQPSVFPVPEHVSSVIVGGGCGVAHVPQNGAVDCAVCYPNGQSLDFPSDPTAPAQEQPAAIAVEPLQPSPPADAPVPVAAAPAPDATADAAPAPSTARKSSSASSAS